MLLGLKTADMSKKFKSQASSNRAASQFTGFGSFQTTLSPLSYITEFPDLSQISDSNVIVSFKNLGKKDSTTKEKALEELQQYLGETSDVSILSVWSELYPRTSIDNSRRVRVAAHTLQGFLTIAAGKKIVPFLPKVIGPWLAGTFDSDKFVARAAQEALEKAFSTEDKRNALWLIYKDTLVDYVQDAVTVQSVNTLSDERTTSPDDAEAKYVRVVGTGIHILIRLLKHGLDTDLLQQKKLWEFSYHQDSYLRNASCALVLTAIEKQAKELDWELLSKAFIYEGMRKNQTGSARQFSEALLGLTKSRDQLWTTDYTAKTPSSKRLLQYLQHGSQNGPEVVWSNIGMLIKTVPFVVLSNIQQKALDHLDNFTQLTSALRIGVANERVNITTAWITYVQTCLWLTTKLESQATRSEFVQNQLIPIVIHYVTRGSDQQWNVGGNAGKVSAGLIIGILKHKLDGVWEQTWQDLTRSAIDKMKLSLPASSKDFRSSQDAVISHVERMYDLRTTIAKNEEFSKVVAETTRPSDLELLHAALELLRSRNGNPYSAATTIEMIAKSGIQDDSQLREFFDSGLTDVLDSPSCERLVSLCMFCDQSITHKLLLQKASSNIENGLVYLLKNGTSSQIHEADSQELIEQRLDHLNDMNQRRLASAILENSKLSGDRLQEAVVEEVIENLSVSERQESMLLFLEDLLSLPGASRVLLSEDFRSALTSKLLIIGDSDSSVAEKASSLVNKFNSAGSTSNVLHIIKQQLYGEGTPLSVLTLTELCKGINGKDELNVIIPNSDQWQRALRPHLCQTTDTSLTITSPLQGVIWYLEADSSEEMEIIRDSEDLSLLFRLAYYVTKVLQGQNLSWLDDSSLDAFFRYYPLSLQLINEKITLDSANNIWLGTTPELLQEAAEILSDGTALLRSFPQQEYLMQTWLTMGRGLQGRSRYAYLQACAFAAILGQQVDENGPFAVSQDFEEELKVFYRSENLIQSGALLSILREHVVQSAHGKRICNELVAQSTEPSVNLQTLILLNMLIGGKSASLESIPQQRIVFMLKNLVHILGSVPGDMASEIVKLLSAIIPLVQEIYGEHWEQMLEFLTMTWNDGLDNLPLLHSTLRLYARLRTVQKADEATEDLEEGWTASKPDLDAGLLSCLQYFNQAVHGTDQPRSITAELLRRQLSDVKVNDDDALYGLLASPEQAVQTAAYELLHQNVPEQQEQLSLELVLEKAIVHLPDELLSLLINSTDSRKYLLSWRIVFDHFSKASHMLREAYTENIKSRGHLGDLLNFLCDKLRIVNGRPVDASKFEVTEYRVDEAQSEEREIQWLSIHIYYACLLYVPGLAKDWYIQQLNRVKVPLEKWTKQYISPLIVAASLDTVTAWAATQSQDEADRPIHIKASPRGSELVASIKVDPESPAIALAVSLPGSYPLESPTVTSRERVGVSDKNWTSWMRTFQIIIFSSGSIIEGLSAFRRNVQLALEGQSECAICYSIIGTDMKTPDKKCGTCKNMFHAVCLYRWFRSSNSSSCPLCRNNFNYA